MTPPLSGAALEILARLNAGQPVDHITEVGRYRTAWTRADVEAIRRHWLGVRPPEPAPKERKAGPKGGRPRLNFPHDTEGRYQQHRRDRKGVCDLCRLAHNQHNRKRTA